MKSNFKIAESLSQKWFGNKNVKNVMAMLDAVCRGVNKGIDRTTKEIEAKSKI